MLDGIVVIIGGIATSSLYLIRRKIRMDSPVDTRLPHSCTFQCSMKRRKWITIYPNKTEAEKNEIVYQLDVSGQLFELLGMNSQQLFLFPALLHGGDFSLLDKFFGIILVLFSQTALFIGLVTQCFVICNFFCSLNGHLCLFRLQILVLPVDNITFISFPYRLAKRLEN